jgi:hypothetical protein
MVDPDQSKALFEEHHPDIVVSLGIPQMISPLDRNQRADRICKFTASMWTPEQSKIALDAAREVNPKVKTLALPPGLQVNRGPDVVVDYIKEKLPELMQGET